jgi:hypothetical protein
MRGDRDFDELDADQAVDAGGDGQFAGRLASQNLR